MDRAILQAISHRNLPLPLESVRMALVFTCALALACARLTF